LLGGEVAVMSGRQDDDGRMPGVHVRPHDPTQCDGLSEALVAVDVQHENIGPARGDRVAGVRVYGDVHGEASLPEARVKPVPLV
jgi:hypothetical protein